MIAYAKPGDRVRILLYDEFIEGVFDRYCGHAGEEGGWSSRLTKAMKSG